MKTDKEKEDFRRHLRRYINIYLPDCPWEVNSTNRYTIVTHEASISARRPIRRNETIKYLSGIQVNITPEEEELISVRKKDFSIVVSSRSKSTSLFMGPARFANHDCDANAALMTTSHAGIEIVAIRNIAVGEEITVTYGENYFGEDNCECLCKSCEDSLKNGWEGADGRAVVKAVADEERPDTYTLRRRRRDDSLGGSSRTPSVTPVMRPKIRKTRTTSRLGESDSAAPSPAPDSTPGNRKRTFDAMATPPVTPAKKLKHTVELVDAAREASRGSSVSGSVSSSQGGPLDTDVSSPEPASEKMRDTIVEADPLSPNSSQGAPSPRKVDHSDPTCISVVVEPTADDVLDSITVSIEPVEESAKAVPEVAPKRKYQRRVYREATPPTRVRTQGDYVLTPLLLSEPAMAWVQCGICNAPFVQQNAYFTRSSCPRCERHSKLYGYMWPKTDKEGPRDKEERILDHRTVHRFLDHYDEKRARGRKGVPESEATPEVEEVPSRGRTLKRKLLPGPVRGKKAVAPKEDTSHLRRSGRSRTVSRKLVDE